MTDCCVDKADCITVSAPDTCPLCGVRGASVDRITLKALLTHEALRRGIPRHARFCSTVECATVYFDRSSDERFTEADLIVPVHAKRPRDTRVPVCYCFGTTPESIAAEIERVGESSASRMIADEVRAGHCACEVRNPKGSCCLGDVIRIEKER